MRNPRLILALIWALALAGTANGQPPPRALAHVDPKAPCFRWPAVDMDADGVFDRIDHCPNTPRGCSVDSWGCPIDSDGDGVCDGLDLCPNTPKGARVDPHGCERGANEPSSSPTAPLAPAPSTPPPPPAPPAPATPPPSESERQLVEQGRIRLENVYFETNSAALLPESEASLNEAGEALRKYPELRIEVEGHTDTRGSTAYNRRLSQSRAETVRAYLLEHFGLNPDHFSARGYGKTRPETRERNEEELLRNRRVVLRALNAEALPKGVRVEESRKP